MSTRPVPRFASRRPKVTTAKVEIKAGINRELGCVELVTLADGKGSTTGMDAATARQLGAGLLALADELEAGGSN